MCHKGTYALVWAGLALGTILHAQSAAAPDWRKVGGSTADLALASPATGAVDAIWYSPDGTRLYARTHAGTVFETRDFENWTATAAAAPPVVPASSGAPRLPDPHARVLVDSAGRLFALGANLYRSEDGGRSWSNLTAYQSRSVIGAGQRGVAVSPSDPDQIAVANEFGVWRSMDGGLTWSGLNDLLPNLPVRRILAVPNGTASGKILADGLGPLEWNPGAGQWLPAQAPEAARQAQIERSYSSALGAAITAVAAAGDTVYAGASDGRLWVSQDGGRIWQASNPSGAAGPIEALYAVDSRVALAASGGAGAHVLRTTNGGQWWDDLTANLPEGAAHGITAYAPAGAVYVATDKGVFWARQDLLNPAPAAPWSLLSGDLPAARAFDVKLNRAGNQLYVALEGYGLYAAPAPHRNGPLQLMNAADYSARAAAPGSLVSVLGGRVDAASAGGLRFPVLNASDSESQIQVPFEASGPRLSVDLRTGTGNVTLPLQVQPVSPAIFVNPDGTPMLMDADSGMMLDARTVAHSGTRIQVLATGLGKVRPDWPTGTPAPLENPPAVVAKVGAFVDRSPAQVTRAVLARGYIGFYLVEVQLPAIVNAGPAELYLTADGQESNRVQIYLEP